MSGDADRSRVDVAGQYFAVQQFRCGDRENSRSGSDVEQSVKLPSTRQALERQETAAGRRMLAGAERGRRVHRDPDRSGRHTGIMMRAVNKKSADPQGRKGQLVFCEPVASRQLFLVGVRPKFRHWQPRQARAAPRAMRRAKAIADRPRPATPRARSQTPIRRRRCRRGARTRHSPRPRRAPARARRQIGVTASAPHPDPLPASGAREQAEFPRPAPAGRGLG